MELKEVHSDIYSLAKLYSLLHEDFPQAVSFILDERTRILFKKLLDDAVDNLLAIHSKIIFAAKSGLLNTPNSSSSTILKTVKDNLEPSDSANEASNLGPKRLLKEEEQSIVKAIQERGPELSRVDIISSKADDGTKHCKICQRSKSMNQVVNTKDDLSNHVNCNEQGPSEKDSKALVPATTVEKLQHKPSVATSDVSVLTSPGTKIVENNRKLEEIASEFLQNLLKALKEKEPSSLSNNIGSPKGSIGNSEREVQQEPSMVRSVVSVLASPQTGTAENDRKPEKIARDFSQILLNAIKEQEPAGENMGSSSKQEREVPENTNKNLKVKDIVQRIESENGRVKGSESHITPTGGSNDLRTKKRVTKSRPYIGSHNRHEGCQTLMKPTQLNYYGADRNKNDSHDDNDEDSDDASSWSNRKNYIERSSCLEESEDELTPSSSQSDPGSSFISSTKKRRLSTNSHSLPRSMSSSVPETSTDDGYIRSKTAASFASGGTYSDQDIYSSENKYRTKGISKLRRLKNKLGLIFHHYHHHHHHNLKNNCNRSKWGNVNRMEIQKTNNTKYGKKAVEELGKAVANNPKYEKKVVEELGKAVANNPKYEKKAVEELGKAVAVEELGKAAGVGYNKKKQNHQEAPSHGLTKGLIHQEALSHGLAKGMISHVKHSENGKTTNIGRGKHVNWWGVLKHHPELAKMPKQGRVKIASKNTKPQLKLKGA